MAVTSGQARGHSRLPGTRLLPQAPRCVTLERELSVAARRMAVTPDRPPGTVDLPGPRCPPGDQRCRHLERQLCLFAARDGRSPQTSPPAPSIARSRCCPRRHGASFLSARLWTTRRRWVTRTGPRTVVARSRSSPRRPPVSHSLRPGCGSRRRHGGHPRQARGTVVCPSRCSPGDNVVVSLSARLWSMRGNDSPLNSVPRHVRLTVNVQSPGNHWCQNPAVACRERSGAGISTGQMSGPSRVRQSTPRRQHCRHRRRWWRGDIPKALLDASKPSRSVRPRPTRVMWPTQVQHRWPRPPALTCRVAVPVRRHPSTGTMWSPVAVAEHTAAGHASSTVKVVAEVTSPKALLTRRSPAPCTPAPTAVMVADAGADQGGPEPQR